MYKKFITPLYVFNITLQSLFSLVAPIALMTGLCYLAVTYLSWPSFLYVIFIVLGVFSGLYSMVCFILSSCRALEALEAQHREKEERALADKEGTSGAHTTSDGDNTDDEKQHFRTD